MLTTPASNSNTQEQIFQMNPHCPILTEDNHHSLVHLLNNFTSPRNYLHANAGDNGVNLAFPLLSWRCQCGENSERWKIMEIGNRVESAAGGCVFSQKKCCRREAIFFVLRGVPSFNFCFSSSIMMEEEITNIWLCNRDCNFYFHSLWQKIDWRKNSQWNKWTWWMHKPHSSRIFPLIHGSKYVIKCSFLSL